MKNIQKEWSCIFLSIISATLLTLSFPNTNIYLFAWFAFIPLFAAIFGKKPQNAFLLGYLAGIVFFFGCLYWLSYVSVFGLIVLVLYLGLYFGVFCFLSNIIFSKKLPLMLETVLISSLWVGLEFIRANALSGFGWVLLGYSQWLNLPVIQIASFVGVWGVSFLIMAVNIALYRLFYLKTQLKQKLYVVVCILIVITGVYIYGFSQLKTSKDLDKRDKVRISVIQGNILQEDKWDPEKTQEILGKYIHLSKLAFLDKPDLIIWPETAIPADPYEDQVIFRQIRHLTRQLKTNLLIGAPISLPSGKYTNSALFVLKDGSIQQRYDKIKLVPFGEYVPFEKSLGFIREISPAPIGDFKPGKEYTVFEQLSPTTAKFSTLICFEDIFPDLTKRYVKNGADFLVNITNDAWFGKSSAPYQHAQASVFRAVENKVPVVRCGNTGFSVFIDSFGRQIASVKDPQGADIFTEGYCTADISLNPSR